MAYSRFLQSDVYVYADVSGVWVTHVASVRFRSGRPPALDFSTIETAQATVAAQRAWLDRNFSQLIPIGLPHDGATFQDPDPGACADRLEGLKALGYEVPDYAIAELRAEAAEEPA